MPAIHIFRDYAGWQAVDMNKANFSGDQFSIMGHSFDLVPEVRHKQEVFGTY